LLFGRAEFEDEDENEEEDEKIEAESRNPKIIPLKKCCAPFAVWHKQPDSFAGLT
jgi:hypothetical protein